MTVALLRIAGADDAERMLKTLTLNDDGRADGPLLAGADLAPGRYRLVFAVADYFRACGTALPDPPFLDRVPLDFGDRRRGRELSRAAARVAVVVRDLPGQLMTEARHHAPVFPSPCSSMPRRGGR